MSRNWDFDAGKLPLNFANTAEWHASQNPQEMLETYPDLIAWGEQAQLLTKAEANTLLLNADLMPGEASDALKRVISIRDVIYRIFSAVAGGGRPSGGDLRKFNLALVEGLEMTNIALSADGFEWTWTKSERAFDQMLWPILKSTAELLTSKELKRVGQCADDRGCGYLFYDTSKNHSRRWCSMESCGNRAKAKRHYQRKSR